MREIVPTHALGRGQEHGRLRFGVKTAKAMKALDFWRFTSTDQEALATLSGMYGGIPRPWTEPRAAVQGQWELLSDAPAIDVYLPAEGALSVNYESWQASGCERRCDGETCTLPLSGPDGDEETAPCLCAAQNLMVCKPKVRLAVALPGIPFKGIWRMESGSWNAAHEMSSIEPVVAAAQARGMIRARLVLEKRSRVTPSGKRNYTVPMLELAASLEELAAGQGTLRGIPVHVEDRPALGAGMMGGEASNREADDRPDGPGDTSPPSPDDDICDAELIEAPDAGLTDAERAWADAVDIVEATSGLARKVIERGIILSASDGFAERPNQLNDEGWSRAVEKAQTLANGGFTITGVDDEGRLKVKRPA